MSLKDANDAERALRAVGEILEAQGQAAAIVIIGGSALNLLGVVDRSTRDVDVLAIGDPPDSDRPNLRAPGDQLPDYLKRAVELVARRLGLDANWLNTGPALQWRQGLPDGFENRITWRRYRALMVGLAGRRDLLYFKLYAAADHGPNSVHYQDLLALKPNDDDLNAAMAWVISMDASPHFPTIVSQVVEHVRKDTR